MLTRKQDKILVVDDEREIGQVLNQFLTDEGFSATTVTDGTSALDALLEDRDYSVVLLDIKMPDPDGLTILKHLQDSGCDTAVIMMSGHGCEELAVESMRNGAEDYISKPFAFDDMLQRVERAISHRLERIEKRQLQKEKEDFILMLSHDMKNPLTAVIGSIDIIREGCLGAVNEEQEEYLQSAIDSCNEVVSMIDNLLDLKKFETGKINFAIRPHKANDLLSGQVSQFVRTAKHEGIELSLKSEQDEAEIAVDRNAFIRVIGNLLGNALKFTPEGGKITVYCQCISAEDITTASMPKNRPVPAAFGQKNRFVKITVSDTGDGIPPNELERIFDRYTQLTRESGRGRSGSGLGLAFCKYAIERFNGMIWAESDVGEGTCFVILLPCYEADIICA